ncbi:diguanylate cyclase [Pantoea sp.]|uniref:GGDEF domain-containing protein n=1 Tax=Pantoea sp. TaxID=69393 RepID=UPI00289BCDB9|nr:diguanylate cyclase [Pantoea sp.]
MRVKLFAEHQPGKNAVSLFIITALFCFIGSHLRVPQDLSLFWPVNALLAGIIVRHPFLHTARNYLACYGAMIFNDTVFSGWALPAVTLNFANILFVVIAVAMLAKHFPLRGGSARVTSALRIFPACLLASAVCATWGALAQHASFNQQLLIAWSDWLSEQFSTGVMLLPFLLTRPWRTEPLRNLLRPASLLPILAVIGSLALGAIIGGAGSLTFPVPALIWCAIVLPIPATSLVVLITGISEIILVAHGVMSIQGNGILPISHLTSARLGAATIAVSPLIVAVSMDAIRQLNQRLALRANYDFLTQLLSRSGLYESLKLESWRLGREAGVVLLDVDYFKTINDNFGHDAGDVVLEEIARRIKRVVGNRGSVCRFGGEEFAIVMFDHSPAQLYQLAEAVRQTMAKEKFWLQGSTVTITVSAGIAHDCAGEEKEWSEVINRLVSTADKSLYLSKRNGRNQTSPVMTTHDRVGKVA